ncbi:helix-turn-helix domain-containing protein [Kitasatospora sp. DSM 101779]|uniref:helix-turn-helix domain-containing protein n=1 Tax=Kitasatospora sp. DSM 101779 TaxID=2853165 RepID=UPI0021DB1079|nr:helix-turn-helix domain-containing protein [Kitasatospora sp. DSM 101779]MCU7825599.1 helix-turn-helix domain-containing protein [Kitasatospora sp. DSM 101779]
MTEGASIQRRAARPGGELSDHEVRTALLRLLAEEGTVTATGAAGRLGYSSGLCSFHLRQLARYGRIEEVPQTGGRARPWRLRQAGGGATEETGRDGEFGEPARDLEAESDRQWLARRGRAPEGWRHDEAFSAVVHLTPEEMSRLAEEVRQLLARYGDRDDRPAGRPAAARPVAVVARLFPLLGG